MIEVIERFPEGYLVFLGIIGFFACIGAVTTLRRLVAWELRLRARSQYKSYYQAAPPGQHPGLPFTTPDPVPRWPSNGGVSAGGINDYLETPRNRPEWSPTPGPRDY